MSFWIITWIEKALVMKLKEFSHIVKSSVSLRAKDFEDAMQYFSAKEIGADCIVTRNVKDFDFAEIEVLTPHEFLEKI